MKEVFVIRAQVRTLRCRQQYVFAFLALFTPKTVN